MTTIFHSRNARSLRVLWVLEEMGVKADVKTLPFPPRELQPEYLGQSRRAPCRRWSTATG